MDHDRITIYFPQVTTRTCMSITFHFPEDVSMQLVRSISMVNRFSLGSSFDAQGNLLSQWVFNVMFSL